MVENRPDLGVYELRARQLVETQTFSTLKGPEYGRSKIKRGFDVICASTLSPAAASAIVMCGLAIWAQDRNNPFIDVGGVDFNGNEQHKWKLRTMVPSALSMERTIVEGNGSSLSELKAKGFEDPRITGVGRKIRKISVDEAPQLFQALRGGWSMVGPRLPAVTDLNVLEEKHNQYPYSEYRRLMSLGLKHGVTGMYVVCGRENLAFRDRFALEAYYLQNQNLGADIKIVAATFLAMIKTPGK